MLELLFELEARVGPPQSLGATPMGERRLVPILGGHFRGRLTGKVLPGGADWQILRSDGFADIDARYQLETDDGHRIEVRSRGLRHGPPDVIARLAAGEPVPRDAYYFRTAMRFETAAPALDWLKLTLAVAQGERRLDAVHLAVHAVK
ncbi:DUF3237 domain-containing protein [Desertibaculum subflavum]|uniref:DUF3237 domain-containing protein n=1 Tax=Desertibaculum subflavum TaxID=2268458 RepID=UPI000E666B96